MRLIRLILVSSMVLAVTRIGLAQDQSSAAPGVKTFSLQTDVKGAAASSVNLFTGDVALPLNLVTLPGHNGLSAGVSISYNSNLQNLVNTWNQDAPTGILGLGWSMDVPKIVCDHKQTGTREDDEYYLLEGGASIRLIRTGAGTETRNNGEVDYYAFETKNYQFWKVRYYYDLRELLGCCPPGRPDYSKLNPNRWEITREDGTTYVYGDKNSGRGTLQWVVNWGNWIGNSSQTNQSQLAYVWNLSEIVNTWGQKITYTYENIEQFVGSAAGSKHTEASYLKRITDMWGQRVEFFYADKASQFYQEPHTEQAEPDAYQEVYERRYLDRIEVLRENNGGLLFTVQLGYGATNSGTTQAKMLLTSVVQKNAAGTALPGMQFSYHPSGNLQGFLDTVTYPTGGTVKYTYNAAGVVLGHSAREAPDEQANAPSGYWEPKIWSAEDYVVVAWRQFGNGNTHAPGGRDVKLYAYQWTGEWKEQYLRTVGPVEAEFPAGGVNTPYDAYLYKDFHVTVQKNFFAVLKRTAGNNYALFIEYKDEQRPGRWREYTNQFSVGEGAPTLVSGDHFVAVGTKHGSVITYTLMGNEWREQVIGQPIGDYFYTATNNYFISQTRSWDFTGSVPPSLFFNYLTADKKWITRQMPASMVFDAGPTTYWYAANNYALVMSENNPKYLYRWDVLYANFYRDNVLGGLKENSRVYLVNDSQVGIVDWYGFSSGTARAARFDGQHWQVTEGYKYYDSFGEDYFLSGLEGSTTYRKVYNPNVTTNPWQQTNMPFTRSATMGAGSIAGNPLEAGNNHFFVSDKVYFRRPDGTWSPDLTLTVPNGYTINDISLRPLNPICFTYQVWTRTSSGSVNFNYDNTRIHFIKNGGQTNFYTTLNGELPKDLQNPYTIIAFANSNYKNSTGIALNQIVTDGVTGHQLDYPVTRITTHDGVQPHYTSFDYNAATATIDPSGHVAQYHEVTTIEGSQEVTSRPNGYTKMLFFNGSPASEAGIGSPEFPGSPVQLMGTPYETLTFDKYGKMVASGKTWFSTFTKDIRNDDGTKIEVGYYVRPAKQKSIVDGIETITKQAYDNRTGLLTHTSSYDYDSKRGDGGIIGATNITTTSYKYFWEHYDSNREKNLLSPVIQTTETVLANNVPTVVGVSATTWRSWNNVFAPHKTYQWKRTGTANFDFTTWSEAGEPTANWIKVSQIDAVDTQGNVVQTSTR